MSSTIENTRANIDLQFNLLRDILDKLSAYSITLGDLGTQGTLSVKHDLKHSPKHDPKLILYANGLLSDAKTTYDNTYNSYVLTTMESLNDYFTAVNDVDKNKYHNQFVKCIKSCNLVGSLKRTYGLLVKVRKLLNFDDGSILKLIKHFESITIDEYFENYSSDICPRCQLVYEIEEKTAEFTCKRCGHIEKMYGVVFEDDQFFYQEGQRTKHGKYDPIKHAKFWLDRIQGKETTDIPESVINAVKRCIRQDQLWLHDVTCEVVRKYLKQTKNTNYNNHVVLIRKIITGIEPDQLTEHEIRLIYMYFGISTQKFNQIKGDTRKNNCPYHPFFIYKIIEQVLCDQRYNTRRKNILSCIHLQSRDTLIENDKMWFEICDTIPEFTKIATDGGTR